MKVENRILNIEQKSLEEAKKRFEKKKNTAEMEDKNSEFLGTLAEVVFHDILGGAMDTLQIFEIDEMPKIIDYGFSQDKGSDYDKPDIMIKSEQFDKSLFIEIKGKNSSYKANELDIWFNWESNHVDIPYFLNDTDLRNLLNNPKGFTFICRFNDGIKPNLFFPYFLSNKTLIGFLTEEAIGGKLNEDLQQSRNDPKMSMVLNQRVWDRDKIKQYLTDLRTRYSKLKKELKESDKRIEDAHLFFIDKGLSDRENPFLILLRELYKVSISDIELSFTDCKSDIRCLKSDKLIEDELLENMRKT